MVFHWPSHESPVRLILLSLLPGRNSSKFSWLVDIALSDPVTSDDSAVDRHLFEYCDRKDLQQCVEQAALHLQLHVLNDTLERLHLLTEDLRNL
jgi:hypothetical protein